MLTLLLSSSSALVGVFVGGSGDWNDVFFQHPPHGLVMRIGAECSKGCGDDVSMNQRDIGEAGPSTPKHAAGSVAKRLAMLPRVATTPKGKGKGKGKAREEEEEEEFIELIQDTFTNKYLCNSKRYHVMKDLAWLLVATDQISFPGVTYICGNYTEDSSRISFCASSVPRLVTRLGA
ncbi:hypothetical protein E4T56_gene14124 [Termitomyces sp. T112]|nr:hypothetical protein E4T56_gene14124 [Termitomyces sp. T112]